MKQLLAIFTLLCAVALSSCVTEPELSGEELESRSLRAWMKKNKSKLLENHQTKGDYYVDVLEWGEVAPVKSDNDFGGQPIMEQDTCWMIYNFTGYDLTGDVCVTRSSLTARMQNSFSKNTHYVPFLNYCGSSNSYGVLEGTYLATRNILKLGQTYVDEKGYSSSDFVMRKGSKVRLYMPSSVGYGATGTTQEGGYEGQFHLDTNVPVIMDVEVVRVVKNPSDLEVEMVDCVVKDANARAGKEVWHTIPTEKEGSDEDSEDENSSSSTTTNTETYTGLYYTTEYTPGDETLSPKYMTVASDTVGECYTDSYDTGRYADMKALDEKIAKALKEKFSKMELAEDDEQAKEVGKNNSAVIWYIARFLDGFVLDTNIPEVRELVFDTSNDTASSSLTYNASTNKEDYVGAWYHCIPRLKYGRWGAIVTTSGYAYGAEGISGSTSSSSTSSSYYDYGYGYGYYDYYNYYNSYSYPYYMSYPVYDTPSYTYDGDTGAISTEVQPYTPLLFYVFIEPTKSLE